MIRRVLPCLFVLAAGCMEGQKPTPLSRGPASKPAGPSLYVRLGEKAGIVKVVDTFVKEILADERIKPEHKKHFREGDVTSLKANLVDQIGEATGGPEVYKGKSMKEAHKGLKITDADFDALVDDLGIAMRKNGVPQKDQDELKEKLKPLRKDIVEGAFFGD
jgi:hemoglobin